MNQNGFAFEYEKPIQKKKPDWLDDTAKIIMESYTYERGGYSSFWDRITSLIAGKCNKYKDIIAANSYRFVIAIYLDFLTGILLDEIYEESKTLRLVFDANESLWGTLFFTETQDIGGKQYYDFYCFCRESSFESIPNWPFHTINLYQ